MFEHLVQAKHLYRYSEHDTIASRTEHLPLWKWHLVGKTGNMQIYNITADSDRLQG